MIPASKPRINGQRGAFMQPTRYGFSEGGLYSVFSYEGTDREIKILAAQWGAAGGLYEVAELHGGRARLDVRVSWINSTAAELPVDTWELEPQEVEKDLLESNFLNGTLGILSVNDRQLLSELVQQTGVLWDGVDSEVDVGGAAFIFDDPATAFPFYLLLKAGVRSYPIEASVIRHTRTVSNRYAVKASFTNVGRILSTSTFISLEDVPSDLLFDVPATPNADQYIQTVGDLQYGWRKIRPAIQKSALQKTQIVNNYAFGLWPVRVFGAVL